MFCDNCGTRVEDGQPFCPNCGKRMGGGPSGASASAPRPTFGNSRPVRPASSGGLLGKFNDLQGLEKIFYPIVGGLMVLNFIMILLPIYSYYNSTFTMPYAYPFWFALILVLLTLCITFFVQDYFDKFTFKWLWFFIVGAMALIFILFVGLWIDSKVKLSVAGWFFFIFQLGLTGCSVMLLLEKMKR